jgi:hypothetical protein
MAALIGDVLVAFLIAFVSYYIGFADGAKVGARIAVHRTMECLGFGSLGSDGSRNP